VKNPSDTSSKDKSLRYLYIFTALGTAIGGSLFWWVFTLVNQPALASGFTAISAIGGVVGGLSLTGTAVLTLNSRMLESLMRDYGTHFRSVLFGGYCLMVGSALVCAVVSMFADQWWSRLVLGYMTAVICAGLVLTALLINSAFMHYQRELSPEAPKESPIQPPMERQTVPRAEVD
jgi:hypothetical protein